MVHFGQIWQDTVEGKWYKYSILECVNRRRGLFSTEEKDDLQRQSYNRRDL